jgi:hypothetical protein
VEAARHEWGGEATGPEVFTVERGKYKRVTVAYVDRLNDQRIRRRIGSGFSLYSYRGYLTCPIFD